MWRNRVHSIACRSGAQLSGPSSISRPIPVCLHLLRLALYFSRDSLVHRLGTLASRSPGTFLQHGASGYLSPEPLSTARPTPNLFKPFSLRPLLMPDTASNRNLPGTVFTTFEVGNEGSPALGMRVLAASCIANVPSPAQRAITHHVSDPCRPCPFFARTPFHSAPSFPSVFNLCSGSLGLVLHQAGLPFG